MTDTNPVPPVWLIETDDGGKTLCDLTGAELDWKATEAACKERGAEFVMRRPSEEERKTLDEFEESARAAGLNESFGISSDPESKVDLILNQPKGFEVARREVPFKESVKAMREMLAEHDLLPA